MSKYTVNMSDQLNKVRVNTQEKLRKESEVVVEVEKPSSLQTAAVDYLSRKEEPHPLNSPKNLNEETLDEGKFKVGDTVIPSVGPHKGRKHEVIADLKNNTYNIKPIGLLAKQIQYRLGAAKAKANQIKLVKEETLDEREKSVRQLVNPTKEVMVVKKNKVVVIDKKDQDKYIKQGWTLAEENELEEARWKVKIEGLPSIYMDSSSAGEVKSQLRKLLKKPDMIQDIERVTDAEVKKGLRDRISGKEVEEQSNDTKGE
jgi:hypothetical protein